MSVAHTALPRVGSSSALVCTLRCLDPRRWFGALLAVLGIIISIVAPLLPISPKAIVEPATGTPSHPHPLRILKRPLPTHARPPDIPSSTAHRSRRRPRTADDIPSSPHVTFSFGPHPRSASTGWITAAPSHPISADPSPLQSEVKTHSPESSPSPSVISILPSPSSYCHPHALPSLDSLDLASDTSMSTSQQTHAQISKRPFRIQIPKLGFGKRKSTTDLKSPRDVATPSSVGVTSPPLATKGKGKHKRANTVEWQGTEAFAIKRRNTIATSPITRPEPTTPLAPCRKFSLFSRDPSSSKDKDASSLPSPVLPQPIAPPEKMNTIPSVPSPTTLQRMSDSPPPAYLTPPLSPPILSPPFTSRVSVDTLEDMFPLSETTTPPARPARTDPYKTYGVPVPGSERARAFLKAEKEWIRAEKERRERERVVRNENGAREREGEAGRKQTREVERGRGLVRPLRCLKKGKDPVLASVVGEQDAQDVDADVEASQEDERLPAASEVSHRVDEFGVLPVLDFPRQEQTQQQEGKSSRGFPRRSREHAREKVHVKAEKRERSKDKDDSAGLKKLTKSRASVKANGSESKDRRSAKAKDRGYGGDTGVPSLTYKLMT